MTQYNNNLKLLLITGVVVVLLFLLTYTGLNKPTALISTTNVENQSKFDVFDFLKKSSQSDTLIISMLEKLEKDSTNSQLIEKLIQSSKEKNIETVNAFVLFLKGKSTSNIETLQQSADKFLNLSTQDSNIASQLFYSNYGKKACDLILKIQTKNLAALTRKASFLIYIDNETMGGVQLLKEVEKIDSNYIEAQHLLMLLAIQSQQFEKAEKRLKKLISLQPENSFYKELLIKIETQQLK
ncbi:MAG: tetratricopeptide repeat protein [Bacteroidetes bacterium]|nr:tetratricopeptide repeat protein [Bacteroidota bacterium]